MDLRPPHCGSDSAYNNTNDIFDFNFSQKHIFDIMLIIVQMTLRSFYIFKFDYLNVVKWIIEIL